MTLNKETKACIPNKSFVPAKKSGYAYLFDLVVNGPGDLGSIPGRVIPMT